MRNEKKSGIIYSATFTHFATLIGRICMFQQLILIGNLGNAPEMRYTPAGIPFAQFRLAVNRRWTGENGQPVEKTTWFNLTAWRKQAELASQYLDKGRKVMVIGEVEGARPYTDREGVQRASIDVTVNEIRFIDSRRDEAGSSNPAASGTSLPEAAKEGEDIPF
jgi:single-strand DNA-binding protein